MARLLDGHSKGQQKRASLARTLSFSSDAETVAASDAAASDSAQPAKIAGKEVLDDRQPDGPSPSEVMPKPGRRKRVKVQSKQPEIVAAAEVEEVPEVEAPAETNPVVAIDKKAYSRR